MLPAALTFFVAREAVKAFQGGGEMILPRELSGDAFVKRGKHAHALRDPVRRLGGFGDCCGGGGDLGATLGRLPGAAPPAVRFLLN